MCQDLAIGRLLVGLLRNVHVLVAANEQHRHGGVWQAVPGVDATSASASPVMSLAKYEWASPYIVLPT